MCCLFSHRSGATTFTSTTTTATINWTANSDHYMIVHCHCSQQLLHHRPLSATTFNHYCCWYIVNPFEMFWHSLLLWEWKWTQGLILAWGFIQCSTNDQQAMMQDTIPFELGVWSWCTLFLFAQCSCQHWCWPAYGYRYNTIPMGCRCKALAATSFYYGFCHSWAN